MDDRLALLASVDLFADLDEATLTEVLAAMHEEHTDPGQTVFRAGDPGDALHVIVEGEATVVVQGRPRRDLGRGTVFGEIAIIDRAPRSATVYAATPLTTLALPAAAFQGILDRSPATVREVLLGVCRRLRSLEADRWAAEQELRLRHLQATFIANIGHELRTPLTVALGYIQLARSREHSPETMQRILTGTEEGLRTLHRLVEDLLDLVLVEQGTAQLTVGPQPLRPLVDAAVALAGVPPERVVTDLPSGLVADADPERATRVLAALLDNAAKFGPPDTAITVTGHEEDEAVAIDVTDAGDGIPLEALETIFDMFVQRDPSATRAKGGLGVGLALARATARLHGGDLVVVDDAPTTTFRVTFPRATP